MLEFVDSDLYFVQDKNNFINPLLQVGSGGPKITGSDRIRILIPVEKNKKKYKFLIVDVILLRCFKERCHSVLTWFYSRRPGAPTCDPFCGPAYIAPSARDIYFLQKSFILILHPTRSDINSTFTRFPYIQ